MNRAKSSCSGSDDGGGMVEAIMVVVAQRGVIVVTMTMVIVAIPMAMSMVTITVHLVVTSNGGSAGSYGGR